MNKQFWFSVLREVLHGTFVIALITLPIWVWFFLNLANAYFGWRID